MAKKGYISEFMNGGRIVSHGKVENLSKGFKIGGGIPFSVYVRPRLDSDKADVVISLKCYQDDDFADAPITLNDWTPLAVSEIAPNDELLESYEIYWGCGSYVTLTSWEYDKRHLHFTLKQDARCRQRTTQCP